MYYRRASPTWRRNGEERARKGSERVRGAGRELSRRGEPALLACLASKSQGTKGDEGARKRNAWDISHAWKEEPEGQGEEEDTSSTSSLTQPQTRIIRADPIPYETPNNQLSQGCPPSLPTSIAHLFCPPTYMPTQLPTQGDTSSLPKGMCLVGGFGLQNAWGAGASPGGPYRNPAEGNLRIFPQGLLSSLCASEL